MREFKRILFNKTVITVFIFLMFLNGMLFVWSSIKDDDSFKEYKAEIEKYKDIEIQKAVRDIEKEIEKLQFFAEIETKMKWLDGIDAGDEEFRKQIEEQIESLKLQNKEYYDEYMRNIELYKDKDMYRYRSLLLRVREQIMYVHNFDGRYEEMLNKAKLMQQMSIFGDKTGFAYKNIQKTLKDFESFKNIRVKLGDNQTMSDFYRFKVTDYLITGFLCLIVIMFIQERKLGLWSVIRTCRDGRGKLAAVRYVIIAVSGFISSIIFYVENIITGKIIYGENIDFSRNIQSIPDFSGCRFDITILEYTILHILMKTAAFVLIGSVMWLLISSFSNIAPAITCIIIFIATEYAMYAAIPVQSNFNIFKFMNIFSILFINGEFAEYLNFSIGGRPVNTFVLCIICGLIMTAAFSAAAIAVNIKKRAVSTGKGSSRISYFIGRKLKIFRGGVSVFASELYKVFVMQKAVFIYILLIFLCIASYDDKKYMEDGYAKIMEEYYDRIEGPVTREKREYVADLREKVMEQKEKGAMNPFLELQEAAVKIFTKKLEAYDEIKENTGVEIWFVNQNPYNEMFGSSAYGTHILHAVIMMLFIVIMTASIFAVENKTRAGLVVRSTLKGRKYTIFLKMAVSMIVVAAVMIPVSVLEICNVTKNFSFTSLSAPVQSIDIFRSFPLKISIIQFFILIYAVRFMILYFMEMFIMAVSQKASSSSEAIMMSIAIFIIPASMYYIGIKGLKCFSFASFAAIIENIANKNINSPVTIIGYPVVCVLGITGFLLVNKNWLHTK